MRYFRWWRFAVGLAMTLTGVMTACYIALDMIALTLKYSFRSPSEGGVDAASMNLSGFVLAAFFALVGLAVLVAGVVQVRRTT